MKLNIAHKIIRKQRRQENSISTLTSSQSRCKPRRKIETVQNSMISPSSPRKPQSQRKLHSQRTLKYAQVTTLNNCDELETNPKINRRCPTEVALKNRNQKIFRSKRTTDWKYQNYDLECKQEGNEDLSFYENQTKCFSALRTDKAEMEKLFAKKRKKRAVK